MKWVVLCAFLLVGCKQERVVPEWDKGEWNEGYTNYHLDPPEKELEEPIVIHHIF